MINRQNGNFTIILNEIVDNEKLSAKAKGIYLYLQSKKDGWQFYESEIVKNFTDGVRSIRAGVQELLDAKLLLKYQERGSGAGFNKSLWILNPTEDDYKEYDTKCVDTKRDDTLCEDTKPATNKTNSNKTNNNKTNKSKNIQKAENHVYFIERKNNDLFYEYLALRKKMKLSNSETVLKRLIGKVRDYYKKGHSIEEIITNAIVGNWKDFYEPKEATAPKSFKEQDRQRTDEVADAVLNQGFDPFDPKNYESQGEEVIEAQIEGGENV